jgi:hypothetical protein
MRSRKKQEDDLESQQSIGEDNVNTSHRTGNDKIDIQSDLKREVTIQSERKVAF